MVNVWPRPRSTAKKEFVPLPRLLSRFRADLVEILDARFADGLRQGNGKFRVRSKGLNLYGVLIKKWPCAIRMLRSLAEFFFMNNYRVFSFNHSWGRKRALIRTPRRRGWPWCWSNRPQH
jgi:hypothetical protein